MRQIAARIHIGLAWLLFLGGCLALYLIALSVYGGGSVATHGAFGRMLFLLSLLLLITSLVCRSSKLNVGLSVVSLVFRHPPFRSRVTNACGENFVTLPHFNH